MNTDKSGPVAGPSGIALPTTAFSRGADRVIGWFGEVASALWAVLVAVIVVQVIARYAFNKGSITMEELQWHLYAIGFMLGIAFTEVRERNVRIDVLAERLSQRTRLWIELGGIVTMLLTFCAFVIWFAVSPGGLPYRWFLKSFIVTAFVLLALAGLSRLSRVWAALFGRH